MIRFSPAVPEPGWLAPPLRLTGTGFAATAALWLASALPAAAVQTHDARPQVIEQAASVTPRRPLLAHVRFCHIYDGQCDIHPDRRRAGQGVAEQLREIRRVNQSVNARIRPRADRGDDRWDINATSGDCEDYALQKRADLLALGWPSDALRVAVVRMRNGVYHAVLLVRVDGTDLVLDNMTGQIVRWDETPYRYLMIQDAADPRAWHDVRPAPRGARTS